MYADFVAYTSGKAVVWGGHSGDLTRLEEFYPVIRRPISYFLEQYHVEYVLLDLAYVAPTVLGAEHLVTPLRQFDTIGLYEVLLTPGDLQPICYPAPAPHPSA
jgi:hypothetical protein